MISFLNPTQRFSVNVSPAPDWRSSDSVRIEAIKAGSLFERQHPQGVEMKWQDVYRALALQININDHQLASMAKGLELGRTLRFNLKCSRSDLEAAGFIDS